MSQENLQQKSLDTDKKEFDPYAEDEVYVVTLPETELKQGKKGVLKIVLICVLGVGFLGALCASAYFGNQGAGLSMFGLCWMAVGALGIFTDSKKQSELEMERKGYMNYENYDEEIIEYIDEDIDETKNNLGSSVAMMIIGLIMVVVGMFI